MDDKGYLFDATEEARANFWTSTHRGGTEHEALNAIAAAAIAQVEAERAQVAILDALCRATKPRFVQVGHHRINADRIVDVEDFGDGINIWMVDGHVVQLRGEDKTAFLLWHEQHADVTRLPADATGPDWARCEEAQ